MSCSKSITCTEPPSSLTLALLFFVVGFVLRESWGKYSEGIGSEHEVVIIKSKLEDCFSIKHSLSDVPYSIKDNIAACS